MLRYATLETRKALRFRSAQRRMSRIFNNFSTPPAVSNNIRCLVSTTSNNNGAHRSFSTGKNNLGRGGKSSSQNAPVWTLPVATQEMASLLNQIGQLEPLPPVWSKRDIQRDGERNEICQAVVNWLDRAEHAVRLQQLLPSGKHGRELSHLLGQALAILSEIPPHMGGNNDILDSSLIHCQRILNLMLKWNLHWQPKHYGHVICAAVRESQWKYAADLFWKQVDPDASGFTPMDDSNNTILGLYAIARSDQVKGGAVAEHVMDAVQNMSMVSPTDQDNYVRWAGVALGRAGEWRACVDYLKNSYNSSRFGQPLVAAAMDACIICEKYDEALTLYDELVEGPLLAGGEWQWGGGSNILDPHCRNLAIQALGKNDSENSDSRAMELFRQIQDEGLPLSANVLCSVVWACEQHGNWINAVATMRTALEQKNDGEATMLSRMEDILISVMRTCNASGQFGVALLCCRLFEVRFLGVNSSDDPVSNLDANSVIEDSLLRVVASFDTREDLLIACMTSLCGLGCFKQAVGLFEITLPTHESNSGRLQHARECYRYAAKRSSMSEDSFQSPWEKAHMHIRRLTAALNDIEDERNDLSDTQRKILMAGLRRAMQCSTAARQPEAALLLASHVQSQLTKDGNSGSGIFSSFLSETADDSTESLEIVSDEAIFAETIRAYNEANHHERAYQLIQGSPWWESYSSIIDESGSKKESEPKHTDRWSPIENEVLRLLAVGERKDDAMALFQCLGPCSRTPETFLLMARMLSKLQDWAKLTDVYHLAMRNGCISVELTILAIKSVNESPSADGKLKVVRRLVRDAARLDGTTSQPWRFSQYWRLKRNIGFEYARLLMWWNDPETSKLKELEFAIGQFMERRESGFKPKNDVIRAIVSGARMHRKFIVTKKLDAIEGLTLPRSESEWIALLNLVQEEIKGESIRNDPRFIDQLSLALRAFGGNRECITLVNEAAIRHVRVGPVALQAASIAAEIEGIDIGRLSFLP